MAIKVKKVSNESNKLDVLKRTLLTEQNKLSEQWEKVLSLKREIFDIENAPYKEGDHIIMEVSQGRTVKECECVIFVELNSLNDYIFKAYPYKNDGSLSNRSFRVYDISRIRYAGGK